MTRSKPHTTQSVHISRDTREDTGVCQVTAMERDTLRKTHYVGLIAAEVGAPAQEAAALGHLSIRKADVSGGGHAAADGGSSDECQRSMHSRHPMHGQVEEKRAGVSAPAIIQASHHEISAEQSVHWQRARTQMQLHTDAAAAQDIKMPRKTPR